MGRAAQRLAAATEFEEPGSRPGRRSVHLRAFRVDVAYDGLDFHYTRHPESAVCRREKPFNRGAMRLVYGYVCSNCFFQLLATSNFSNLWQT